MRDCFFPRNNQVTREATQGYRGSGLLQGTGKDRDNQLVWLTPGIRGFQEGYACVLTLIEDG